MYQREALKAYGQTPPEVQESFRLAVERFERVFREVPKDQPWRAEGWNALQIQGHLIKTHELGALLVKVLESEKPHHRLLHLVAAAQQRSKAPRTISKLLAPKIVQLEASETELASRWSRTNQKFLSQLDQAHLTGKRTFPHLYIGELTALEWAQFMPYHLDHHLPQLEALQVAP
ncbi:DinB family protein [Deinococcus roseus]|uniref:DinB-like domain-containing protein n=1 Tax=Deinococcus roseus TaxID=392414 RepID=A0ABQ2CXL0_9DEIO|nr:DinB family protein [Deinococcus roseus]GGJ24110.1 hypothetical protein GCM10008938_07810 [Deinococcus roseus]